MMRIVLTGLGAGAAAALLFASVTSGVALSLTLMCLAPLPVMIAALDASPWAGLLAAVTAAALLGGEVSTSSSIAFLLALGAPACWLGYLALLGRPVANGGGGAHMEWYPPGRLVLWAAVIGAAVSVAALATLGTDEAAIRRGLRYPLEVALCAKPGEAPAAPGMPAVPSEIQCASDVVPMVDMMTQALPPFMAVFAALVHTANLWLAGVAVRLTGRLRRPWPDLTALSFPPYTAVAYGACLAAALLPGLTGLAARLVAAVLTMAFAMVGFAVLHTATRGMRGRAFLLWGFYGCVVFLVFVPVVLAAAIAGVAETLFGLRQRLARHGPPAAHNP
jgi:hypothetical protein